MKVKAFCPGHISCIFAPCHHPGPLATGSKGLGIVMGLGSEAYVAKRDDDIVKVTINGIESDAPVTKHAITSLAPGEGFDVFIRCPLPQGQGFGTSASGTLATAMCVASIMGMDDSIAVKGAHTAEHVCGGGLGDVSGLLPGTAVTARMREGVPPFGESVPVDIELKRLTVAVLGPPICTQEVIGRDSLAAITAEGEKALAEFLSDPSEDSLYRCSGSFAKSTMLETGYVKMARRQLAANGYRSGMCMLGNSVFTDASVEEARSILGLGALVFDAAPGTVQRRLL